MGIRWQLFTPIYEVHNRMTNFGEYTGQIELAGQNGNSRALYNQYNGIANFLPRIGLAWTPWDNNTVIRAGVLAAPASRKAPASTIAWRPTRPGMSTW